MDFLPSIGEVGLGLPSMPSLPSLPDFGLPSLPDIGLPTDFLPHMPSMPSLPDIGEMSVPLPSLSSWSGVENYNQADVDAAGTTEAERGMARKAAGLNVVGMSGNDGVAGEDGPLFSGLTDHEDLQQFGRLHDVEAAMAEKASGGGTMFTIANVATAALGAAGTVVDSPETGARWANGLFETLGYPTGDYARVQGDVAARH